MHVLGRVRTEASVRSMSSFKRGNMLSLGISGGGGWVGGRGALGQ